MEKSHTITCYLYFEIKFMEPDTQKDTLISIIITYNKIHERCLKAVESINKLRFKEKLEIIIICIDNVESEGLFHFPDLKIQFIHVKHLLEYGKIRHIGVEKSNGDLIFFLEEHCEIVGEDCIEKIIDIYQQGYESIGPEIIILNQSSKNDIVNAILCFFPFLSPSVRGEYNTLPGNNAIYSKVALESVGEDLPDLLGYDMLLADQIKKNNYSIFIEPDIKIRHAFEKRFLDSMKVNYYYNIVFSHYRKKINNWNGIALLIRIWLL